MAEEVRKAGHFSRMPAAAILDPWLPEAARNVLSVICIFVNEQGEAWPSIPTIATGAGCSERTVQRMLKALESRGYITIRRTKGGSKWTSNLYQVNYPEVRVAVTPMMSPHTGDSQDVTPQAPATVSVTERGDSHGVTIGVTKSVVGVTPKVAHEQPILEQPKEQPTAALGLKIKERKDGIIVYENGEWEPETTAPKPARDPYEGLSAEDRQWSIWSDHERRSFLKSGDITRWHAFNEQLRLALEGEKWHWPPDNVVDLYGSSNAS